MKRAPYIVGITGGSASGKTIFLKKLIEQLGDSLCVISQDDYYHSREKQPKDFNGIENFDTPQSIDIDLFLSDLQKIASGKEVSKLEYTFNNPSVQPKTITYKPSNLIIVEGIFLLYYSKIAEMLDLKVYIDANDHIKLKRRILRDQEERGYDLKDVLYRYEYHVSPNYDKFIKPFKEEADIIIPNNRHFDKGLEVLVGFLKNKISNPS
jgi:uridine kinase